MIFGCWGEDKSCKSTLALSFPRPMVYMEFDIGGFQRACRNLPHLPIKTWYDNGEISYEAYPLPLTFGTFDPSKLELKPSKQVVGMKELFYKFAASYVKHLQDPKISTIVIDTATILKSVTDDAYLQEIQEKQLQTMDPVTNVDKDKKPLRQQLQQIEYKEPNSRTRGIYYNAKSFGKHLVLTHHARDEYKPIPQKDGSIATGPTGKRERSGFATLGDSADMIVYCYWKDAVRNRQGEVIEVGKPYCKIELAGVKELEGMVLEEPTYEKIESITKMMRGEL
jgi:hypothetical protein